MALADARHQPVWLPPAYHLTNVLLHVANTVLAVQAHLLAATDSRGRSAFVAALFALHPLHVESVAWIAERKDVLSTFFGLLAMLTYMLWAKPRKALAAGSGVVLLSPA